MYKSHPTIHNDQGKVQYQRTVGLVDLCREGKWVVALIFCIKVLRPMNLWLFIANHQTQETRLQFSPCFNCAPPTPPLVKSAIHQTFGVPVSDHYTICDNEGLSAEATPTSNHRRLLPPERKPPKLIHIPSPTCREFVLLPMVQLHLMISYCTSELNLSFCTCFFSP